MGVILRVLDRKADGSNSGQGIGREVAISFAQAGAKNIHIPGRTENTLNETKAVVQEHHPQVDVGVYVADITNETAVNEAARKIGKWDVLIANAGYIPTPAAIADSDAYEW